MQWFRDRAPMEWNMAYFDLAARVMDVLPLEEADRLNASGNARQLLEHRHGQGVSMPNRR